MCRIEVELLQKMKEDMKITKNDKEKIEKEGLWSKAFFKCSFSEHFIQDVSFLKCLSGNPKFYIRYANVILRDMLE